ncbi:PREDICTED: succinate dehydrogenase assembly factor 2, mitochondrial isoform X2 [Theobroma cacao]|uniref:Succinate dehydrogenase assembly factor 2, mitochondrial isoform X2 n=1 Tax=Theobroma cacao TaxID=3641 RepID=A0AB32W0I5_THECC|nr:PREDICTED: succinate dehydrogenase assembly factor 2, mitochondrial isoform X2 [Theobroma cacao]
MATLRRALLNAHRILNSSTVPNRTTIVIRPQYGWVSRFSSTNISNTQPLDIDLSSEESKRRLFNRLLYRSKQRGFLELDLVLGKWVEEHIYSMDENGIKALVHVLDLENPDLWKWLTGQEQPPETVSINPVRHGLLHSAREGLEKPQQPFCS